MIKITNKDGDIKIVTQGAYEEYFEYLGYKIADDKKQSKNDIEKETKDTKEDIKEDVKSKKEFTRK